MKHNKNHDNALGSTQALMPVHFEFTHLTAVTVCIAGTFNDWHPTTRAFPLDMWRPFSRKLP